MKPIKLIISLIALLTLSSWPSSAKGFCGEPSAPEISFDRMEYDFGSIKYKSRPQSYSFEFTNTGNIPLVITDTYKSCSCLSVKYPRKPVQPGEKGVIEISYNPNKFLGEFNNYVKIFSNATEQCVLFVRGKVSK